MGLAAEAGEIDAKAIVVAFDGEGAGLALPMAVPGEDQPAGVPEVGAEGDVRAVRKLIQAAGRLGSTIPQRPSADFLGSTSKSPPPPAGRFFGPA